MININNNNLLSVDDETLMLFAIDEYLSIRDVTVNVIEDNRTLDKFSTEGVTLKALLHKNPIPHSYNFLLRKGIRDISDIICHEMVHLGQYESMRLSLDMASKTFTWENEEFPASVPYEERPWEIEAFSEQGRIKRAYKRVMKGYEK